MCKIVGLRFPVNASSKVAPWALTLVFLLTRMDTLFS